MYKQPQSLFSRVFDTGLRKDFCGFVTLCCISWCVGTVVTPLHFVPVGKHAKVTIPPRTLSPAQFRETVQAKYGLIFDLRSQGEYQTAHVPGALSFPSTYFEGSYAKFRQKLEADKSQPITIYCASESCDAASRAWQEFAERGFSKVAVFPGGVEGLASGKATGRNQPMKSVFFDLWLPTGLRWFIGILFIDAGTIKVRDPQSFVGSVASFHLLPASTVGAVSQSLPWLEMICGALIVGGWYLRPALFTTLVLEIVFVAALSQAMVRGIDLDCGCFGPGSATRSAMWLSLGRDIILLGLTCLAYRDIRSRQTTCRPSLP